MLTQTRLQELLTYDPATGVFVWKTKKARAACGDKAAQKTSSAGYSRIGIDGRRYLAHRLAWLYVTGCFPEGDLDHINRDRKDNRLANLREVTRSQNLQNRLIPPSNTSGFKGVYWHARAKKWQAQIKVEGKGHYLGIFDDVELAAAAYARAAERLHSHRPTK